MPPKRSDPPPAPVASDEETTSGSGSEEEDEEGISLSPPPTASSKGIAPPPGKDQESEASDEDEDGEEEEEEDDDDDEEEEEDGKANNVTPSSATKNLPPPPPTRKESETSEEEEAADGEMPQTIPAPNQEIEAKGAKRPSAPFQRTWSIDDEFRILEALAAHRLEHGTLPQTEVLANALAGKLDNSGCSHSELQRKVKSLQSLHSKAVKKGAPPSKDHACRLFDLCKNVWPSATKVVANSGAGREPDEMCKLYPYLAEEVKALEKSHPGLFKREFAMIYDSKARALDDKIKKVRHTQMKQLLRRDGLIKEVTKTLIDLTE